MPGQKQPLGPGSTAASVDQRLSRPSSAELQLSGPEAFNGLEGGLLTRLVARAPRVVFAGRQQCSPGGHCRAAAAWQRSALDEDHSSGSGVKDPAPGRCGDTPVLRSASPGPFLANTHAWRPVQPGNRPLQL